MGSEFFERNKRKSALALLLLLLGGRGRYVAALFVAVLVSVPFLVSGDRLNSVLSFPAVAAVLRAAGIGVETPAANVPDMRPVSGGGAKASFWEKYLRAANAPLPPAGATSTMAMLRGGGDVFGPPVIKDDGKPAGPGKVKGAVNAEERASGDAGAGVDLTGILGNMPGGGESGVYGDLMGQNLGDRQGGAPGPYANRAMLGARGGAAEKGGGIYNQVMTRAGENVPVPGSPVKMNGKMGRVSGFAWRNVMGKTRRSQALGHLRSGNKTARFQVTQAATMIFTAMNTNVPEYQASYVGSTYDGNSVDADTLAVGDDIAPSVPSSSFADGVMGSLGEMDTTATECDRLAAHHAEVTQKMIDLGDTFDYENPPNCCDSDSTIDKWNDPFKKEGGLIELCEEANSTTDKINQKCSPDPSWSVNTQKITCSTYTSMVLDCGDLECAADILTIIVGAVLSVTAIVLCFTGVGAVAIAFLLVFAAIAGGIAYQAAAPLLK